jgi:predicted Zn-dependent protease
VSIDLPSSLLDARPRAEPLLESEALAVQAELLLNRGYTIEAEKHLIHLREINIRASAPRLLLGRQLVIAGRADDAVLTLTGVVADDPLNPAAHHHLAKAYLAARKPDLALDQYQSATALSPKWSSPWYGASIAAMALGRDADAAAATVALRTLVSGNGWLSSRAWDLWPYRGREDYLIADAREVIGTGWRQSAADYLGLLASLAYERQGQTADAQTLLAELMVGVEPGWVTTIAMFLKGELSAEELISKASTDGERTEAHAYVGVKASLAGDVSTAREHLTWVKDQGLKRFMEYGMAVAELEWLDRQKP